jgi:ribosomal protein S21
MFIKMNEDGTYDFALRELKKECEMKDVLDDLVRMYQEVFEEKIEEETETKETTKSVNEEKKDKLTGHYNFDYNGLKVDPYFVSNVWKLGSKDDSGVLFHILKTIARFGEKNPIEREIKAMNASIKRLAELYNVQL